MTQRIGPCALALIALGSGPGSAAVTFTDVTAAAGVVYLQHEPREPPECLLRDGSFCEPERMSGGAAVGDVDGDGWPDLFVTRLDAPDLLFRNRGDGSFEDFTAAAGLDGWSLPSNGAAFGDIDNDRDLDLYVTTIGDGIAPGSDRFHLFVNDGSGHFTEEALARGAAVASPAPRGGQSAAFGDYDRDGWLDLHVTEWLPESVADSSRRPHARLLRNLGAGTPGHFEDVTEAAGAELSPSAPCPGRHCGTWGFASTFTDLDGDGWLDLAVAADFSSSRLFWNEGDGTFLDGTAAAGVGTDENGMGSTFGDYDGDGDLDWFVTSIFHPDDTCAFEPCGWGASGNRLYRNEGGRVFSDATDEAGVRNGHWGWGAAFFDADNDGDLDLAMTNGVDFPGNLFALPFHADPMRYWENHGAGPMRESSALVGLTDTGSGKGLLVFDYDRDGDLDVFLVNNAGQPRLYRNDGGNDLDWLRVRARGVVSNAQGIGARVEVTPAAGGTSQIREIGTGSHFLGHGEPVAHFGLGSRDVPVARVRIAWPSGRRSLFHDVLRNSTLVATEPCTIDFCTPLPAAGCAVAEAAKLRVDERRAGREKLRVSLRDFPTPMGTGAFGDPIAGATAFGVCIYDDGDSLRGALEVDRAGERCGVRAKPCWKSDRRGLAYVDVRATACGVSRLYARGGEPGTGKVTVKARNRPGRDQVAMPARIAGALAGATHATVQIQTSDAACFEATVDAVGRSDASVFKAKKR